MRKSGVWLAAAGIGVTNAVLLYAFEFVGIDVTEWLWDDVLRTDTYRWMVPAVAVALGLVLTALIKLLGEKRVVPPQSDLMKDMDMPGDKATLRILVVVLAIGAMSLLAGASLGPEASLMTASAVIGIWVSGRFGLGATKKLLVLASVGALLVAFLGSPLMVLVPLLLLLQEKKLRLKPVAVILLAGLASFGTIWLIDRHDLGYGEAPVMPSVVAHDYWVALAAGFATAFLAVLLNWLIKRSAGLAKYLDSRMPWYASTLIFGLVLGVVYLLGGQTVQFSGSIGSHILVSDTALYGVAALIGLVAAKLLATSWSKATGYRGGLVFPSIYIGVALGLLIGRLQPEWAGAGAMIGGIAGMLSAVTGSPVIAAIFVLAVLPTGKPLLVALFAIIGTMAFSLLKKRLLLQPAAKKA